MTRPTISDVAAAAGVSRGTVSRVLNGSPKVSPAARTAVEKAIKATAFRSNPHARSLASGRNNAVAVLLTQPQHELFEDPTFSLLLQGVSNGLAGSETSLVLLLAGTDEERRRTERFLDPSHIDGVVHLSPHVNDPLLDRIQSADVPAVVCGEVPANLSGGRLWSVTVTDRRGAREATQHLRDRGSGRLAVIAGPTDAPGSIQRVLGCRDVLGDDLNSSLQEHGDYSRPSGRLAMSRLLEREPDIDAVFCASDRMAAGAVDVILDSGRRIPHDIRLVGFDDHAIAQEMEPRLSTVRQPMREIGRAAVQMLTAATHGEDPGHRVFNTELVIRASS